MIKKIKYLIDYFKYLDNPIECLKFKFGILKNCNLKIKHKKDSLTIDNVLILNKLMCFLPITPEDKYAELIDYYTDLINDEQYIILDNIKYINILNSEFVKKHPYLYNITLDEYFSGDSWDMVDFKNRHVIDIGGNVADTALDFAKKGAEVIAFEPVKHLYTLGLENISLNPNLKNKITFVNKAVGAKRGKLNIAIDSLKGYIDSDEYYDIEVITVTDILNEYNIKPDILKIDCEGCEFEIIPKENLSIFSDVLLEHHSKMVRKDYNILIEILEKQGFKINKYECNVSRRPFDEIGIIHAYK